MKIRIPWIPKVGGLAVSLLIRSWMRTLDYRVALYDETVDPAMPGFQGPAIFLFWHEYIPFPFYLRGHCNIAMLLSRHYDAEFIAEASRYMGFQTIRGSTSRGGVASLREALAAADEMNLTMTPDGPRGPRRTLAQGCIYMASRLGIPLVCLGLGYDRPWRLKGTWDQFAVPRPGSRARMLIGPAVHVPAGLNREQIETYRCRVESELELLTDTAEQWAASGKAIDRQLPLMRSTAPYYRLSCRPPVGRVA
ncbi:MAG: lysophospholipid acyltransferase family protein [Planctomycetota bacterium]|nr:lysophospholipid acyltransferase family protein [Planctomycetota bacterium]